MQLIYIPNITFTSIATIDGEITHALLFCILGESFRGGRVRGGGVGGDQKFRTVFENSALRPVFHR